MYPYQRLSLLITLIILFTHVVSAASVLRRDPSGLINIRHPTQNTNHATTNTLINKRTPYKLTIQGHGIVAIPVGPSGELVEISPETGDQNINNDPSSIVRLVEAGGKTWQIIGNDITVTGDDDDEEDSLGDGQGNSREGGGTLTPGQLAAMAFAKAAEELMAEKGGKGYEIDPDSGGIRVGVGIGESGS